jgi:hypothetical protein
MRERPFYSRICKNDVDYGRALAAIEHLKVVFPCELLVLPWKPRRTEQQNRYLWGVVYRTISGETGNEVNDLHDYFLGEFFGWEEYDVLGRKKMRPRERSSRQVKARFSEYIEFIISRAANLGIVIPPPEC